MITLHVHAANPKIRTHMVFGLRPVALPGGRFLQQNGALFRVASAQPKRMGRPLGVATGKPGHTRRQPCFSVIRLSSPWPAEKTPGGGRAGAVAPFFPNAFNFQGAHCSA